MNFPAFKHKNYRIFFAGHGLSLIGTWLQTIATSWLVFRLTNSALLLGLTSFTAQIATFICSPWAGVIIEDLEKKKILIISQVVMLLQAATLALLLASDSIVIWHIFVANFVMGVVGAFEMPTRQAFVIDLVDNQKEDLLSAIALNSSIFNGARLLGPMMAGILIASFGEVICFSLNAGSFLFILVALFFIRIPPNQLMTKARHQFRQRFKEGINYVKQTPAVTQSFIMIVITSIAGLSYYVLLPAFATHIFNGDSKTFGLLSGFSGLGALVASIFLASNNNTKNLQRYILNGAQVLFLALLCFSFSTNLYLSLLLQFIMGAGGLIHISSINTQIQMNVSNQIRGRIMSLYTMAFVGAAPLGSLITGSLGELIGIRLTVTFNATVCLIFLLFYRLHLHKKPVVAPQLSPQPLGPSNTLNPQ